MHIHEVNLQGVVGGGEVYTRAFTRALRDAGARVTLYVNGANRFWDGFDCVPVSGEEDFLSRLPAERSIVLTQGPISRSGLKTIAAKHYLAGVAHLPIQGGRDAEEFRPYDLVLSVSRYCVELLQRAGLANVYPEAMYGVADAGRGDARAEIRKGSPYQWDRRKARDRVLGWLARATSGERFARRPGLTLGIVSLLVPIKQFPALFACVAPALARHRVNLEIFGAGGYAQVRDMKRALGPALEQARFWGYQRDVAAIYPQLDYLVTGLPEKEALGLNVLEAQVCGTPVIAPRAPPFTETIVDGASGFLYRDPRQDGAADFDKLIGKLQSAARPDPRSAAEHLARFSYAALVERAKRLIAHLGQNRIPA